MCTEEYDRLHGTHTFRGTSVKQTKVQKLKAAAQQRQRVKGRFVKVTA